jgi:hypothetical protein
MFDNHLTRETLFHTKDFGGTKVLICGDEQSGKISLAMTLAETIHFTRNGESVPERETVIWRGQLKDHWVGFQKESTSLFIHKDDKNTISFWSTELAKYDHNDLPQITYYNTNKDLYSKLSRGKINVIYEPSTYKPSKLLKKLLSMGMFTDTPDKILFKDEAIDTSIWWFEFLDWMCRRDNDGEFNSIFLNDAQKLLPDKPTGDRYFVHLFFKDIIYRIRRSNTSLYLTSNNYDDIDHRVTPKTQYKIWMNGSTIHPAMLMRHYHKFINLNPGEYYIERECVEKESVVMRDEIPNVIITRGINEDKK